MRVVARTSRVGCLILLGLALPAVLAGALGPRYGGELRVGVLEIPGGLEPPAHGGAERLLSALAHETLVQAGADGLPVPGLASGWISAAGAREWTLVIREGAVFHDDRPVSAEDAVRSIRRFLRSPSPAAERLAESLEGGIAFRKRSTDELPGLAAGEPRRVVLRLTAPRPLPLAPLAAPAAALTSARGTGSGPFVPTVHVPGRRLSLTAFGGHARGRPYLDRIQIDALPDRAPLSAEIERGRIDLAPGELPGSPPSAVLLLLLDPARSPFDRLPARAAVAESVDRADLARLLPGADASPMLLVPALLPPLVIPATATPGHVEGALTMAVAKDVAPLASQRVVAHLGAIGLQVSVVPARAAELPAAAAHARLFLWFPEVAEAGLALRELASFAPVSSAVQEALAAAEGETNLDRRRADLLRAEAALRADRVLVPLASLPVSAVARRGVHGATVDLAGRLVLEDAWTEP